MNLVAAIVAILLAVVAVQRGLCSPHGPSSVQRLQSGDNVGERQQVCRRAAAKRVRIEALDAAAEMEVDAPDSEHGSAIHLEAPSDQDSDMYAECPIDRESCTELPTESRWSPIEEDDVIGEIFRWVPIRILAREMQVLNAECRNHVCSMRELQRLLPGDAAGELSGMLRAFVIARTAVRLAESRERLATLAAFHREHSTQQAGRERDATAAINAWRLRAAQVTSTPPPPPLHHIPGVRQTVDAHNVFLY